MYIGHIYQAKQLAEVVDLDGLFHSIYQSERRSGMVVKLSIDHFYVNDPSNRYGLSYKYGVMFGPRPIITYTVNGLSTRYEQFASKTAEMVMNTLLDMVSDVLTRRYNTYLILCPENQDLNSIRVFLDEFVELFRDTMTEIHDEYVELVDAYYRTTPQGLLRKYFKTMLKLIDYGGILLRLETARVMRVIDLMHDIDMLQRIGDLTDGAVCDVELNAMYIPAYMITTHKLRYVNRLGLMRMESELYSSLDDALSDISYGMIAETE